MHPASLSVFPQAWAAPTRQACFYQTVGLGGRWAVPSAALSLEVDGR